MTECLHHFVRQIVPRQTLEEDGEDHVSKVHSTLESLSQVGEVDDYYEIITRELHEFKEDDYIFRSLIQSVILFSLFPSQFTGE